MWSFTRWLEWNAWTASVEIGHKVSWNIDFRRAGSLKDYLDEGE
jgi:hypothetical protein